MTRADDARRRFDEFIRDGFTPPQQHLHYFCGWCGTRVTSNTGLYKREEHTSVDAMQMEVRITDIRVCPECWSATTFVDTEREQFPGPLQGDNLDARKKSPDVQLIIALYNEARFALSLNSPSCAVLMFRKLLMHIAVEQGASAGLKFIQCVEYLKTQGIVGKPQHGLLGRIKDEGNIENHEIRRATPEMASDLLNLTTLLVRSVYFST